MSIRRLYFIRIMHLMDMYSGLLNSIDRRVDLELKAVALSVAAPLVDEVLNAFVAFHCISDFDHRLHFLAGDWRHKQIT